MSVRNVRNKRTIETDIVLLVFTQNWIFASIVAAGPVLTLFGSQENYQIGQKYDNHSKTISLTCEYPAKCYGCKIFDRLLNFNCSKLLLNSFWIVIWSLKWVPGLGPKTSGFPWANSGQIYLFKHILMIRFGPKNLCCNFFLKCTGLLREN